MLLYYVDDCLPKLVLPGHFHTISDMGSEDQARHGWRQPVVSILTSYLVFDKIKGLVDLTNIMIVAADPCQQGISAYSDGCGFPEASDDRRMMISSRCFKHKLSQNRAVHIGKL